MFGPHVDYRLQGQITSLKSAGGTNLKGIALLYGFGLRAQLTPRFFIQQSYDVAGEYDLKRNTSDGRDDKFSDPFGVRLKVGYALFKRLPNLTLDLDIQHLMFRKITIAHAGQTSNARQTMGSIGLTYHFGGTQPSPNAACDPPPTEPVVEQAPAPVSVPITPPAPVVEPVPAPTPLPAPAPAVPEAKPTEKTETRVFPIDLKSGPFDVGSQYLGVQYKSKITEAAAFMKEHPDVTLKIEGHADTAEASPADLGLKRAEAVKVRFVEAGIEPARLKTEAVDARQPASTEATEQDRRLNRRVDVIPEWQEQK